MSPTEAKKALKDAGYLPGRDRTDGLDPDLRATLKTAIATLKADGSLADYIAAASKPPKKRVTKPEPEE